MHSFSIATQIVPPALAEIISSHRTCQLLNALARLDEIPLALDIAAEKYVASSPGNKLHHTLLYTAAFELEFELLE